MQSLILVILLPFAYAQFSQEDQNEILAEHNSLRSSISAGTFVAKDKTMPAAKTPLPMLTWSTALENSAQSVSDKCVFAHSHMAGVGENLYYTMSPGGAAIAGSGKAASQSWAKEFQDFGWSSVHFTMELFNSGIGHATQMAWETTTQIGCGATLCEGNTKVIVVCHYQAQGNFLGQDIYTAQ